MATFERKFYFNDNIMVNVSNNIKKYRNLAGITQEQLAADVGKSYDFIRRIEYKKGDKSSFFLIICLIFIEFFIIFEYDKNCKIYVGGFLWELMRELVEK